MKRRIALSAGHSNAVGSDNGACYNGLIEGQETVKIRNTVKSQLEQLGVKVSVDPDNSVTYQTVALFKQFFKANDIVVDIHINASSSIAATGTEVLIPAKYSDFEYQLASELSSTIAHTLGLRNRGVKTELDSARKKLLWMTIPAENILIECFFMSNVYDTTAYKRKFNEMCYEIASTLYKYLQR